MVKSLFPELKIDTSGFENIGKNFNLSMAQPHDFSAHPELDLEFADRLRADLIDQEIWAARDARCIKPLKGKLVLDDGGFQVLAHAIQLSYIHYVVSSRSTPRIQQKISIGQKMLGEISDYFDFLKSHALTDDRIDGISRADGRSEGKSITEWDSEMSALIASQEDIVRVRFMDIEISSERSKKYNLTSSNFNPSEKRQPIARQNPNEMIRRLKWMVMDYFKNVDNPVNNVQLQQSELPESFKKANREKAARRLLNNFHTANPGRRISGVKAKPIIMGVFGIGKTAFEKRVWIKRDKPDGLRPGPIGNRSLEADELQRFYEENQANYGFDN